MLYGKEYFYHLNSCLLCEDALNQIDKKHYEDELNEEGYNDIIKYGIAFYRKDCLIKVRENLTKITEDIILNKIT